MRERIEKQLRLARRMFLTPSAVIVSNKTREQLGIPKPVNLSDQLTTIEGVPVYLELYLSKEFGGFVIEYNS